MKFFRINSKRIINLDHVIDITAYDNIGEHLVNPDFEVQFGIIIQLETEDDIVFTGEVAKAVWDYFSSMSIHITEIYNNRIK